MQQAFTTFELLFLTLSVNRRAGLFFLLRTLHCARLFPLVSVQTAKSLASGRLTALDG